MGKINLCLPVQTYTMQSVKFLHIAYFIFESILHHMHKTYQEFIYLIYIYCYYI